MSWDRLQMGHTVLGVPVDKGVSLGTMNSLNQSHFHKSDFSVIAGCPAVIESSAPTYHPRSALVFRNSFCV